MAKKDTGINLDELRRIVEALSQMMKEHNLSELSYESGGVKVSVKRLPEVSTAEKHPSVTAEEAPAKEEGYEFITAPMPGTFYRSPAPGANPFVEEGDIVGSNDTICIIEAMKVMNEIKPGFDCQIVEILTENGQRVEYGQKLFKVKRV